MENDNAYDEKNVGFASMRGERRSFFCSNKLWWELEKTKETHKSISKFVREAVLEKLSRENKEKEDFYKTL